MSKKISVFAIVFAFVTSLLADYSYENSIGGEVVTSIVRVFVKPFSKSYDGPTAVPTPFYQDNQVTTFLIVGVALFFILMSIVIEVRRLRVYGKNKQSAGVVSVAMCLLYFNSLVIAWNI